MVEDRRLVPIAENVLQTCEVSLQRLGSVGTIVSNRRPYEARTRLVWCQLKFKGWWIMLHPEDGSNKWILVWHGAEAPVLKTVSRQPHLESLHSSPEYLLHQLLEQLRRPEAEVVCVPLMS
jgi:hypothetical protein